MRNFVGAVLVLAPLSATYGQHPLVLSRLNEFNEAAPAPSSDVITAELLSAAKKIYASREGCLKSQVIIDRIQPATGDRYVLSSVLNKELRNAWTVTARLPQCDTAPVRFMIMQNAAGTFKTIRVNRGESYAWDSLIADVLPIASVVAQLAVKRSGYNCDEKASYQLGVTRISSADKALGNDFYGIRYTGAWTEIWPVVVCGHVAEVMITFSADGDGGAFHKIAGDKVSILKQ